MKIVIMIVLAAIVVSSAVIAKGSKNPHFKNTASLICIMSAFCLSMAIVYTIGTLDLSL